MSSCPHPYDLQSYVDGALGSAEYARVSEHLRLCEVCNGHVAELERLRWALQAGRVEVPDGLHQRVLAAVGSAAPVPKLSCRRALQLASAYLDDELSVAEREAVEAHLFACEGCYAEYVTMRTAVQVMRDAPPVVVDPWLRQRVLAAVARDAEPQPVAALPGTLAFRWSRLWVPVAAAAAMLLVAVGVFTLVGRQGVGEAPTPTVAMVPVIESPAPEPSATPPTPPASTTGPAERAEPTVSDTGAARSISSAGESATTAPPIAPSTTSAAPGRRPKSSEIPPLPAEMNTGARGLPSARRSVPGRVPSSATSHRDAQPQNLPGRAFELELTRPERAIGVTRPAGPSAPVIAQTTPPRSAPSASSTAPGASHTAADHRTRLRISPRTPGRRQPATAAGPTGSEGDPPPPLIASNTGVLASRPLRRPSEFGSEGESVASQSPGVTEPRVAASGSGGERLQPRRSVSRVASWGAGGSDPRSSGPGWVPTVSENRIPLCEGTGDLEEQLARRQSRISAKVAAERRMSDGAGVTIAEF